MKLVAIAAILLVAASCVQAQQVVTSCGDWEGILAVYGVTLPPLPPIIGNIFGGLTAANLEIDIDGCDLVIDTETSATAFTLSAGNGDDQVIISADFDVSGGSFSVTNGESVVSASVTANSMVISATADGETATVSVSAGGSISVQTFSAEGDATVSIDASSGSVSIVVTDEASFDGTLKVDLAEYMGTKDRITLFTYGSYSGEFSSVEVTGSIVAGAGRRLLGDEAMLAYGDNQLELVINAAGAMIPSIVAILAAFAAMVIFA